MSKTEMLTARAWKFVKVEYKANSDPWVDEVPFWPNCEKDDQILFKIDQSYILSEGLTKCNPSDPDIMDIATWKFLENETKIDMDGAVTTIDRLDAIQFIISASTTSGTDTYYYKYTLEH